MKPERPDPQVIFDGALPLSVPSERAAYLARACAGDETLRQEVESLLKAYEQAGDFLGQTLPGPPSDFLVERTGTMIGRYRLLEKRGEGGFGVVYLAEQLEPVRRQVALKIIKPGMDTREVVARFEAERQALALMDHPNIAKVLDGGATEAGRPYFVMELVRGIPLTEYCDRNSLSTTERLNLFNRVCHAVQHAHQKGIIHRDLKPSNVLVTLHDGEAMPKVIDFGVAKALGQKLTEKTLFTAFECMVGTPAYMSPEQAELSGLDIDTRSDIYSLGVLLYELLTGVTPFDAKTLRQAALDELRRMIRETEPPRPSTRLQTLGERLPEVAKRRRTDPVALGRIVRGDLDWIVMKCLEKDRTRRYDTATSIARDIERHLRHEPVTAAAPGKFYLFGKFVRRNKAVLGAAAALVLLLGAGALVSTLEAVRATRAEREQARLRRAAETARNAEAGARLEATKAAQDSRARLVRLNAANGSRLLEQGDLSGALAWFAEAFRLDTTGAAQQAVHRRRLGALLRQAPRPIQMWFHTNRVTAAMFDAEGTRAITAGGDRVARVVSWPSAQVVSPTTLHSGPVAYACLSPDGGLAASAGPDGVLVWRAGSGAIVHRLQHPGAAYVVFSADGRALASAGGLEVRAWDPVSGNRMLEPVRHTARVNVCALSPDGRLLATGTDGGRGEVWNVFGPRRLFELRVSNSIRALAFSPGGELVAAGDWAGGVFLWRTDTGASAMRPLPHDAMVADVVFSHDGQWLASSSLDLTTKLWRTDTGALLRVFSYPGFAMESAFDADDRLLVARRFDGWINFWNARTGREDRPPIRQASWVSALALHPNGRLLLSGCSDGSVRLLDLEPEGARVWPWPGRDSRIVGSSVRGDWIITQGPGFRLAVWDTRQWRPRAELDHATRDVLATFVDPEARRLLFVEVSSGRGGAPLALQRAALCDLENGQLLKETLLRSPSGTAPATVLGASSDCTRLALGRGPILEFWDCLRSELLGKPTAHPKPVEMVAFSPDGSRALANCGLLVHVLDVATGGSAMHSLTNNQATRCLAYSPDGKWIASGGSDVSYNPGEARVWDSTTGELHFSTHHSDGLTALAFSPDGRWLATGSEDRSARVWDLQSREPVSPRLPHPALVETLTFSPDGQLLASATSDGDVWVWDVASGEPVTPPLGRAGGTPRVRFLGGSKYVLTQWGERSRLWSLEPSNLPVEDLVDLAQLFAGYRVDPTGTLEPLPAQRQADLYQTLRQRHPECFQLEQRPQDPLAGRLVEILPRDAAAGREQIDLTSFVNARLADSWHGGAPGNGLERLPTGLPVFDGVTFDVRGIVQLTGRSDPMFQGRPYPEQVRGIPVGLKCRRLHFLQATGWSVADGIEVGRYVIHYANGQRRVFPLLYGNDVRDWWVGGGDARPAARASIAWDGVNAAKNHVALYHSVWENPLPEAEIKSIDFRSTLTMCAPFLIALTAEP